MTKNYLDFYQHLQDRLTEFGSLQPGPMAGFSRLYKKSIESGSLDSKTKELMALAIGIAVQCEGCIAYHLHDAIEAGATKAEILETISVAIMMGGGPASIYAVYALDAMDQFLENIQEKNEP